jgi:hypothetical protein
MPAGRQVLDLLLGDAELDAVLADSGHGADRDRHYLTAEHVSLLEQHVGDLMAIGVDDEPWICPMLPSVAWTCSPPRTPTSPAGRVS